MVCAVGRNFGSRKVEFPQIRLALSNVRFMRVGRRLGALERRWGSRYTDCEFDNFKATSAPQRKAVSALKQYAEDIAENVLEGHGVIPHGPAGTGKDHLLISLTREAVWGNFDVAWVNGRELFAEVRNAMGTHRTEESILVPLIRADVLYISDPLPPMGELTNFQSDALFRVLDARYAACRPTWVSMNVANGEEADTRMGAPLVDRLRHDALVIHCDWPSYRKARA